MIDATDLLEMRKRMTMAEPMPPMMQPNYLWGTQERPKLRFGGKDVHPDDPMYDLIQHILLQQLMPPSPTVQGSQG